MEESIRSNEELCLDLADSVQKKTTMAVDPVTLGPDEAERVQAWIEQLGEASKGFWI